MEAIEMPLWPDSAAVARWRSGEWRVAGRTTEPIFRKGTTRSGSEYCHQEEGDGRIGREQRKQYRQDEMQVKCEIWRSSAGTGPNGRYDSNVLDVDPTENVLGVLVKIHHDFDASLAFRFACGVVKCGECAVEVNGSPCLACEKAVEGEMKVRPSELPLIKDLGRQRAVLVPNLRLIPTVRN
jgi:ferredoxin